MSLKEDHHALRDPRSPKLRHVFFWNLTTFRFGGDCTPQSSFDKVIGNVGMLIKLLFITHR